MQLAYSSIDVVGGGLRQPSSALFRMHSSVDGTESILIASRPVCEPCRSREDNVQILEGDSYLGDSWQRQSASAFADACALESVQPNVKKVPKEVFRVVVLAQKSIVAVGGSRVGC